MSGVTARSTEAQLAMSVQAYDESIMRGWRALPYRGRRACCDCGQQRACAGRRRVGQRCLDCFARLPARRR